MVSVPQKNTPFHNKISRLPQKCIGKIIDMYRDRPCLWNLEIPEYRDYNKKSEALDEITEYTQQFDPTIEQRDVLKKLESLRSSYRAELRKIRLANTSKQPYTPRLWFFDKMTFLPIMSSKKTGYYQTSISTSINNKQNLPESPQAPATATETEPEQDVNIIDLDPEEIDDKQCVRLQIFNENDSLFEITEDLTRNATTYNNDALPSGSTTPGIVESVRSPQIETAGTLVPPKKWEMADEYDAIGVNVAAKLRGLSTQTRVIAEKLINDVLFHAQMDTLNPYTLLANTNEFTD